MDLGKHIQYTQQSMRQRHTSLNCDCVFTVLSFGLSAPSFRARNITVDYVNYELTAYNLPAQKLKTKTMK